MSNIISGLIAITLVTVFFMYYAVKLHSVALWIIIGANIAFIIVDFVQSVRENGNNNGK